MTLNMPQHISATCKRSIYWWCRWGRWGWTRLRPPRRGRWEQMRPLKPLDVQRTTLVSGCHFFNIIHQKIAHLLHTSPIRFHGRLFFGWWLEQGSLEEVHCCLTTQYYFAVQSTPPFFKIIQSSTQYHKFWLRAKQSPTPYYILFLRTTKTSTSC